MTSRSYLVVGLIATLAPGCSSQRPQSRQPWPGQARDAITALLDSVAIAISNRDADALAARTPDDSSIVYVSDGYAIRGTELHAVLRNFYSGLRSLAFRWDSVTLAPRGGETWNATSWAHITATDTAGHASDSRAIFTWTIVRRDERWVLALTHKTTLR